MTFYGFGKCSLFEPVDGKIKTWPLRFPAKENRHGSENPNMEKALLDWPIVLQSKAKQSKVSIDFQKVLRH